MLFVLDNGTVDFRTPPRMLSRGVNARGKACLPTILLIYISGVVSKKNIIVALYRMTEWMDDGHGTQAPMTGDWSHSEKKNG
jgi:hypothetical protein